MDRSVTRVTLLVLVLALVSQGVAASSGTILEDLAYGPQPQQQMDVYLPETSASLSPVLLMVHGGGWRFGDKGNRAVWLNKRNRWVPRGWVLVSVNYPMLPEARPDQQRQSLALALAAVAQRAPGWHADPDRIVLMGHSAGAHLVALLATATEGATPIRGAVLLDSAALNLPVLMSSRHLGLYDRAFGSDPEYWRANSAFHALHPGTPPLLLVCSSERHDSCPQAEAFAAKATQIGVTARVLRQPMDHRAINSQLGLDNDYTEKVEEFLSSLIDAN